MANSGEGEPMQIPKQPSGKGEGSTRPGTAFSGWSKYGPLLEQLIVDLERNTVSGEVRIKVFISVVDPEDEKLFYEMVKRPPTPGFLDTKVWKQLKILLTVRREQLHKAICVDLDYCKRKHMIHVSTIIECIVNLLKFFPRSPETGETIEALGSGLEYLGAMWLFTPIFLDKFCGCQSE